LVGALAIDLFRRITYRYTYGRTGCSFTCGVLYLEIIVRVRGLLDDKIRIILQTGRTPVENILPRVPQGKYSYRTWRNSRFYIIQRMLLCLHEYYMYGNTRRISRLASKPLHVYILGCVMGKVLDLQRHFFLETRIKEDDESRWLLPKEIQ
jgi:hypothetical protein